MFAQVTGLRYWKSEHDEQTCEDVLGTNAQAGLFAIADGVGTTLFSNIWAKLLVGYFLNTPLMSENPFEVEWWLRQAQQLYQRRLPAQESLPWNALQKAQSQGSHATLATVRVSRVDASSAHATFLVFGDSCIMLKKAHARQVTSFPLEQTVDFDSAPTCLPSKLSIFNRYFHRCEVRDVDLEPGDTLMLATDTIARWIISCGGGRHADQYQAFCEVAAQTPGSWPVFIDERRARSGMVDDDCTAVTVTLSSTSLHAGVQLGSTSAHTRKVRKKRTRAFMQAVHMHNKELVALLFGDGADLRLEGASLPDDQVQQARQVADALSDVLRVLRQAVNGPDALAAVEPVWQRHASLLHDEPCAATLRQTLARLGVSGGKDSAHA